MTFCFNLSKQKINSSKEKHYLKIPVAVVSIWDSEDMEEVIWKIYAEKHVDIYPQLQGHSFQKQCINCSTT